MYLFFLVISKNPPKIYLHGNWNHIALLQLLDWIGVGAISVKFTILYLFYQQALLYKECKQFKQIVNRNNIFMAAFINKTDRKTLPRVHLITCQGVKLFFIITHLNFSHKLRFVTIQVLSQVQFLSHVTIWVFEFCHNLSFWVLSQLQFLSLTRCDFLSFIIIFFSSQFDFFSFDSVKVF